MTSFIHIILFNPYNHAVVYSEETGVKKSDLLKWQMLCKIPGLSELIANVPVAAATPPKDWWGLRWTGRK